MSNNIIGENVNGLSFYVRLTADAIDETAILEYLKADECGAVSVFVGTTRNHHEGRSVVRLEYEAFVPMAEKQLRSIVAGMKQRWPGLRKAVLVHRLGEVRTREASVVVGASSAHRQDSLQAVEYGIEEIKAQVAIWKKECYGDGGASWKENKECGWIHPSPSALT